MKIDLKQFPLKAKEHPSFIGYGYVEDRTINRGLSVYQVVVLDYRQYEIMAAALHKSVPQEKELPDSNGYWYCWSCEADGWMLYPVLEKNGVFIAFRSGGGWNPEKGRWVKIQEPEPIK